MSAVKRLSRIFLVLMGLLLGATAHAVPLDALHAISFLESATSSSSCLAVNVLGHRLITASTCPVDSLTSIRNVADASVTMSLLSQIALTLEPATTLTDDHGMAVQWEDSHTRVLSLKDHGDHGDHARRELSLPSMESYPLVLQSDDAATIVEVDADTLYVNLIGQVVYVDPSLCQLDATKASVCVLPLKLEDRGAPKVPTNGSWRLLIRHDAVSNTDVLLGFDFPRGDTGDSQASDGFRSFTWLANNFHDASFAALWPELPRQPLPQEDRVLGPPVGKLDAETQYITSLHKPNHSSTNYFCTGSLISSRYVLTAAHCNDARWVAIGRHLKTGAAGEVIMVIREIAHPKYDPLTSSHDVMLLELEKPSSRKPIRLFGKKQISATKATVMGYGLMKVGENNESQVLRAVELPLAASNEECTKKIGRTLDESDLCAGGEEGKDACIGDSGGPLVINPGTVDQRIIGVVSNGTGCGLPGALGVYSRVTTALPFIYVTVKSVGLKRPVEPEPSLKTRPQE